MLVKSHKFNSQHIVRVSTSTEKDGVTQKLFLSLQALNFVEANSLQYHEKVVENINFLLPSEESHLYNSPAAYLNLVD